MKRAYCIALMTAMTMASAAHSAVITFDELAFDFGGPPPTDTVTVGDFIFEGVAGDDPPEYVIFGRNDPSNADPGGAALGIQTIGAFYTMRRIDGAAFDISSIDVTHLYNDLSGDDFSGAVSFYYDGVAAEAYAFDGNPGYQHFGLSGVGIHQLGLRTINYIAIDNLVLSRRPTSNVPEPTSWAMMLGGFGAVGGALRVRRRPSVSSA